VGDLAIRVDGLGKQYQIDGSRGAYRYRTLRDDIHDLVRGLTGRGTRRRRETIWALRDVSFEVKRGEALGIIGRNGAGKSTLLKVLSRITEPTTGSADVYGRTISLLEVGSGFHPELTGRENVFLNGAALGMSRHEIRRKFDRIVAFAEIEPFVETPVKRYSSGMYLRLAFAVAANLDAEILVIDETLAVGDAAFQRKCVERMQELSGEGRTVLFVSHNMAAVEAFCQKACLLKAGRVAQWGEAGEVVDRYVAEVASVEAIPLAERTDRTGEGRVRLRGFALEDSGGHPVGLAVSGRDLTMRLAWEASSDVPLAELVFGLAVGTLQGSHLFECSTELVGARFDGIARSGSVCCTLPRLPLAAGSYSVNLIVRRLGVIEDWVRDAIVVNVEAGDFFGAGRPTLGLHAGALVDQRWQSS
jgi:lipopolysaccharide transport system ATP-binding protein